MIETFRDRADAGHRLADRLGSYAEERPIVIALPRGGVITAYEIAKALRAPLDVLIVRKLGAAFQPEFGVGAIAEGGVRIVDRASLHLSGMSEHELEEVATKESAELVRRQRVYRAGRQRLDVQGRTVIVVDDGVATAVTLRAAVASLRKAKAGRIIVAVGVCSPETAQRLRHEVDDVVCVLMPSDLVAVGLYFDDFHPVNDDEVVELLSRAPVARLA